MNPLDLLEILPPERVIEADPRPSADPLLQPDQVVCGWCGMYSPVGPACDTCGSPLTRDRSCQNCGQVTTTFFCWSCRVPVDTKGNLLRKS